MKALSLIVAIGVLGIATPAEAASPRPGRFFSVVIGSNLPHTERAAELRYAFSDAARMYRLLRALPGRAVFFGAPGSVPPDEADDVRADVRDIEYEAIRETLMGFNAEIEGAKQAGWTTHLIFYYSGHGDIETAQSGETTQGRSYIPLGGRLVNSRDLLELVDSSAADLRHVLLDACQAAGVARSGKGAQPREVAQDFASSGIAERPEIGVIAAATPEQTTVELSSLRGGLLTHVLHAGLVGAADADGDARITYKELYRFAMTAGLTGDSGPHGLELKIEPPHARFDTVLVDLSRASAPNASYALRHLVVDASQAGRYRLFVGNRIYAEWRAEPGHAVDLRVPRDEGLELHRCLRCERPGVAGKDEAFARIALAPDRIANADRVLVRWPRWESFRARGEDPGEGWPWFRTAFGPGIAEALKLPDARGRRPRIRPKPPTEPPVVLVAGLSSAATQAQLESWGRTTNLVLEDRITQVMDARFWDLRFIGDLEDRDAVSRAREAIRCDDTTCLAELAGALGINYAYVLGGRLDQVDDARVAWSLKLIDVKSSARAGYAGGIARADKSAVVDTVSDSLGQVLAKLPNTRTPPAAVDAPVDLGDYDTLIIDDAGPPELQLAGRHWPAWVGVGVAAVGVGLAGVGVWAWDERGEAERDVQRTPTDRDARRRFDRHHDLAAGSFGAAGVLGAAAVGLLLWDLLSPREAATVPFAPTLHAGPGAAQLRVRF